MINVLTLGVTLAQGATRALPPGRPLAALIFLALQRGKVTREEFAHLLWDAGSVRSERHSLSQLLYSIKQVLPRDALTVDGYCVGVEPTSVTADYNEFFRAIGAKDFAAATSLYRGAFLSGFPIISEAFDEWRSERAAAAESTAVEAYRVLVDQAIAAEDISTVAELCTRALQIARHDPFFIRAQIEALAAHNEIGAALAAYGLHRRLLIRETGSTPPWMTEDFVSRISVLSQLDTVADSSGPAIP